MEVASFYTLQISWFLLDIGQFLHLQEAFLQADPKTHGDIIVPRHQLIDKRIPCKKSRSFSEGAGIMYNDHG